MYTAENFDASISSFLKAREAGNWSMELILISCVDPVHMLCTVREDT